MRYLSTRGAAGGRDFEDVLLEGLAPDGGLFVPEEWPDLPPIPAGSSYPDVVAAVMGPFVAGSPLAADVGDVVPAAYSSFAHPDVAPLRAVGDGRFLL